MVTEYIFRDFSLVSDSAAGLLHFTSAKVSRGGMFSIHSQRRIWGFVGRIWRTTPSFAKTINCCPPRTCHLYLNRYTEVRAAEVAISFARSEYVHLVSTSSPASLCKSSASPSAQFMHNNRRSERGIRQAIECVLISTPRSSQGTGLGAHPYKFDAAGSPTAWPLNLNNYNSPGHSP